MTRRRKIRRADDGTV